MADLATLQTRLTEAEAAYHRLRLGEKDVEVRYPNAGTIRLNEADADKLAGYISDLKAEISNLESGRPRRSPIYMEG